MHEDMEDVRNLHRRFKQISIWFDGVLSLAQPFFALLVFLSVLSGALPLWISWSIALFPSGYHLLFKDQPFPKTPFDIAIGILTAGMLLGYFLSPAHELAVSALNTYLAGVLFYYSLVRNSHAKRVYWVALAVFLLIVLLVLSVIVFSGTAGKQVSFNIWIYNLVSRMHLFSGTEMHSNVLGVMSALCLPVLFAVAIFHQKPMVRVITGAAAIVLVSILAASASGGGWIAAAIGLLIVLFLRGFKILLGTLLSLGVLAGITVPLWYGAPWLGNVLPYQNLLAREDFWKATLIALKTHPVTGLGLGGWWTMVQTNITPGGPHSSYLQLYSDCGILGLIALITGIVTCMILCRKILTSARSSPLFGLGIGLMACMATFAAHSIIENMFVVLTPVGTKNICFTVPLLWIILALLVIVSSQLSKKEELNET